MFYDEIFIIVAKDRSFTFEKLEDLKGKKLGYCRGCSFGKLFEESKKYFIPMEVDDSKFQSLKLLTSGRIDGVILAHRDEALKNVCNQSSEFAYEDFIVLKKPLVRDPNYLAIAKKLNKKPFLKAFNHVLKAKIESGEIDTIIHKYIK
jgi:ABC-type amino acid transport substrate-binding protein